MNIKSLSLSVLILLVLFSTTAGLQLIDLAHGNFFPDPGPDLPRIYIRNDGSVEPATAPIERTGSLYKLTDNIILHTIEIQRDNIVLDGSDYLIQGNESWMGTAPRWGDAGNNGVIIAGLNNVTITRLNIEKCTTGVRISSSSQISIVGNMFTNETAGIDTPMGIAIQDSSLVLIENNNFTNIHGSAIVCNGTNNMIRGNTITGGGVGSIDGSIALEGSSNIISDNKIEDLLPITMDKADSNIIARNNITGPAYQGSEGIALFVNCSNNVIFGNNITGFINHAIRTVFSCSNNTIYGNYMANNGFAIALQEGAVNNTFYGNTFTADSCKIQIDDGVEGTLWDNGTIGNYWGDYNGTDSNGDGIGDAPYTVNGFKWDNDVDGFVSFVSGQDNYPLMEPTDMSSLSSPLPEYASPLPSQSQEPFFTMPKEYINYTITTRNGTPWAIVDGTYPIYCPNAGNVGSISMVYPTPPNTTNILIKLNETQLSWTNFTEQFPDAQHHTAIGDWAMIETSFNPSEFFVLSIHYEHPIMPINGGYQFLYDLNISPYLSTANPTSTAYFSLKTGNALPDLRVFTVPSDDTRSELEYVIQNQGGFQEVTFAVTSEYAKPLPGDVLVTFSGSETQTQEPLPLSSGLIVATAAVAVMVGLGLIIWHRRRVSR